MGEVEAITMTVPTTSAADATRKITARLEAIARYITQGRTLASTQAVPVPDDDVVLCRGHPHPRGDAMSGAARGRTAPIGLRSTGEGRCEGCWLGDSLSGSCCSSAGWSGASPSTASDRR
ncbi:hypothetical protein GCM10009840_05480 [Pseudolysinimonas kribbensis]|uniref:Uncharacterized protein n=1 Tax=Pseudolysinimonas kribbensis TaxID=433641 RepID=A0ABQ6K830_9MICO|nr:hypothetical protein GCM10025881_17200 [Pseudolysinimonas kribbensis]